MIALRLPIAILVALLVALVGAVGLGGCVAEPAPTRLDAVPWGARYATTPPSGALFSCADCHRLSGSDQSLDRLRPGAPLGGVTRRPHFWGGTEPSLLAAINHCRTWFMNQPAAWTADDPQAIALYAFLASLAADLPEAWTFTAVDRLAPVPLGNALQGGTIYAEACAWCHGAAVTGKGRAAKAVPRLPGDTFAAHPGYTDAQVWAVFVQKVRHGPFWGYGGVMPPFGLETLTDDQLGDLLAYLQAKR